MTGAALPVSTVLAVIVSTLSCSILARSIAAPQPQQQAWRWQQLVVKRGSAELPANLNQVNAKPPATTAATAQQTTPAAATMRNASSTQAASSPARISKLSIRDHMLSVDTGQRVSIVTQSALTFLTVFVFGCAIVLAIFAWKRFTDSTLRLPLPYQYSALSQFDQDRDDDLADLEENLHMLVEDSSSEEDAAGGIKAKLRRSVSSNHSSTSESAVRAGVQAHEDIMGDDEVFLTQEEQDRAAQPATLTVSENLESSASLSNANRNGRPSVTSLLDESDDEFPTQT